MSEEDKQYDNISQYEADAKTIKETDEEYMFRYILLKGKKYSPAVCPQDMQRGSVGDCFDISLTIALKERYHYVEGLAEDPHHRGQWILHAWVTDGVKAYDPTWRAYDKGREIPIPTQYIGFEIPTKPLARFVWMTKHKSVFANCKLNPILAQVCLPDSFEI